MNGMQRSTFGSTFVLRLTLGPGRGGGFPPPPPQSRTSTICAYGSSVNRFRSRSCEESVDDARLWQRKGHQERFHSFPAPIRFASPTCQPSSPATGDFPHKIPKRSRVEAHPIILEMTPYLGAQLGMLLDDRLVPIVAQPFPGFLDFAS